MKELILIVEDEKDIVKMLEYNLKKEGFRTLSARNGESAVDCAVKDNPGLILLDLMLPGMDGLEVCKALKSDKKTAGIPIIMLTAKSQESDKIVGLELGADDYITKPFDSEVLMLKIKAIIKRNEEDNKVSDNIEFQLGKYHFNPRLRELKMGDISHTLSPKENELLKMLAENINDLLTREKALKKIWGSDTYFNGRSMDVYIAKLRKYLREDNQIEIVNIHGNGFRLVVS